MIAHTCQLLMCVTPHFCPPPPPQTLLHMRKAPPERGWGFGGWAEKRLGGEHLLRHRLKRFQGHQFRHLTEERRIIIIWPSRVD